jgi:hypothetical protein
MISTVVLSRVIKARVKVEHPDTWTPEDVEAAAEARAIDVNDRAQWWDATQKTAIDSVEVGVSDPPPPPDGWGCCPMNAAPLGLDEDDLAEAAAEEAEDAAGGAA